MDVIETVTAANHPVSLRPVVHDDLPVFYEQQLDPQALEMAVFPRRERAPFMAHWNKIMADGSVRLRTILFGGKIAGHIVCFMQSGEREVGYWIGREYWGRGVATAALRLLLKELPSRPLYAHVAKRNPASRRVLEKCGFKLLREDNAYSLEPGVVVDEYVLILEV
jgi:RimJ/RimL family protein N-acetyltransferase